MISSLSHDGSDTLLERPVTQFVLFTDLDGSLLDGMTYSFHAAIQALREVRARGIPLVLVSSKTRAEMEPLRARLDHRDPFIVENGAAVFIPQGRFDFPIERARKRSAYDVIELGLPYHMLRDVLKQIEEAVETPLRGFGDLSVGEIMRVTGLSKTDAELAKQREYDEPYLVEGPPSLVAEVCRQIIMRGLHWTKGGRLFHLTGRNDKGQAAALLLRCYQRQFRLQEGPIRIETIGIGDSLNDAPLLTMVDHPVLVQRLDGTYDPDVRVPGMIRADGIGPVGWNRAVLDILDRHS
ncbi:Glucosyl-3-phosphoglycerate/mannosyl-3-phosphoglycerate phosphatase [Nitrospira japonica]|uniref:Glucosyl-3-phosphoglycerate/mannosyl-3-phosphoglycerate phosphatase n=1 Tax=Nitrospira japonica TaxID=1325564 RepID=A0A1W1IAH4_9BACT|nr:HAD-IIB family hydrolase [Nitrospira japonica]SLM50006.1 Glucosyl-3-phosphoglycerate/mannosyl-3-phosphoglycerate phosphatase [Nitrospira japonica]